jgi:thiamine pyrophosphate-dependent acetolactate synthase large subunit-like protein
MNGAEFVANRLVELGITQIWAVQGGSVAVLLDACERHPDLTVRYQVLERDAGYAADGANRAAGRQVAACIVTTGPGLAGVVPAIDVAWCEGIPLTVICGEPRSGDAFQPNGLVDAVGAMTDSSGPLVLPMDLAETEDGTIDVELDEDRRACVASDVLNHFEAWVARATPQDLPPSWVEALAKATETLGPEDLVFADAGRTLAVTYKHLSHLGPRLILPMSQAPMGWAVGAASGAAAATGKRCLALVGDGSLETQIQACYVARAYRLPVHVVCLDTCGYSAIRAFQISKDIPQMGTITHVPRVFLQATAHQWVTAPW